MKTVCKKLLTLMLVAVMLVSAIPFQAFAFSADTHYVTVRNADTNETMGKVNVEPNSNGAITYAEVLAAAQTKAGDYESIEIKDNTGNTIDSLDWTPKEGDVGKWTALVTPKAEPKPEKITWRIVVKIGDGDDNKKEKPVELEAGEKPDMSDATIKSLVPDFERDKTYTAGEWYVKDGEYVTIRIKPIPQKPDEGKDPDEDKNPGEDKDPVKQYITIKVTGDKTATKKVEVTKAMYLDDLLSEAGLSYLCDEEKWELDRDLFDLIEPGETVKIKATKVTTQPDDGDDDVPAGEKKVRFDYEDKDGLKVTEYITTKNGKLPKLPTVPHQDGYEFDHWEDENGRGVSTSTKNPSDWYVAKYRRKADSYSCKLNVYGVIVTNGRHSTIGSPLLTIDANKDEDVLETLQANQNTIKDKLANSKYSEKNGYVWENKSFYTSSDLDKDDKVATNTKITGDRNYYIRLDYTGKEKVQIYIHTSNSNTIKDTVTLTTYAPGSKITKTIVSDAVKAAGWKWDTLKMYTADEWDRIVGGGSASEAPHFIVEEGTGAEIHVRLYNGYRSSTGSSTNKSDNPKTGDAIFTTVSVMGTSVAALAVLYFFNKKKLAR